MRFQFLVGVEGTGHHMIRAVLERHLEREEVIDEGEWHRLLTLRWGSSKRFALRPRRLLAALRGGRSLRSALAGEVDRYRARGVTHLFESASFPFGQPRDARRRPDLVEFDSYFGRSVDVRYLVLYRDPIAATYSAIRRGFTDDVLLQCRIVDENFRFIAEQCARLPAESFRVLRFDEFLAAPRAHVADLVAWWGLDAGDAQAGLNNLQRPATVADIPLGDRQVLEGFFTAERVGRWEAFYERHQLRTALGD